jgi:alkanesulfonate monooxygenase SsuD/methylene tetrahydromethanopterin reductase-like flavin-dependent oxidoreductase (luciferase family)
MQGHASVLTSVARRHNLTLRELRDFASAASGHRVAYGTPESVADNMEEWFSKGAADGFMVATPYVLQPFENFVQQVVPQLQKRGLFRSEYEGSTLREHLGLPYPAHPASSKEGPSPA